MEERVASIGNPFLFGVLSHQCFGIGGVLQAIF